MYAVNALYDGAGNVKIDPAVISINAPYRVIVTFVEPAQEDEAKTTLGVAPNFHDDILTLCAQDKFMGYISAHTIPTAHYIL
jgi:hypothetical protein